VSNTTTLAVNEHDTAFTLALLYVALPCLIFLLTFVQPALGLPLAAALAFALWQAAMPLHWRFDWREYLVPLLVAAALVALVGIVTGHAAYDWIKHWALINEIADNPWPVRLELQGEPSYLRFYLAAYLVPALLHKASGMSTAAATAAWYLLGFTLLFRLFAGGWLRRPAWVALAGVLIVLMVGGADALAEHALRELIDRPMPVWFGVHYEGWATRAFRVGLQFASVLTNMAWVPHQSIPVLVAAAMIVGDRGARAVERLVLVYGLMALWSPYGMIGMLPFMLYRALPHWRHVFTVPALSAVLAGGGFALLTISYLATEMPQAGMCAACLPENVLEFTSYIPFFLVELLPFVLILRRQLWRDPVCAVALGTLLLIPMLHGDTLDFVARGSMGPLLVLALRSAQVLLEAPLSRAHKALVALAFALCLPTTLSEVVYHASNGAGQKIVDQSKPLRERWASHFSRNGEIHAADFFDECGWDYVPQYFTSSKPRILK